MQLYQQAMPTLTTFMCDEKNNLPTTGPFSFLFARGFAIHLFMMPKISRFATETQVHKVTLVYLLQSFLLSGLAAFRAHLWPAE